MHSAGLYYHPEETYETLCIWTRGAIPIDERVKYMIMIGISHGRAVQRAGMTQHEDALKYNE